MVWTCSFAAWPVPTTAFFTMLGRYSVTGRPARPGASSTAPRATPSLRLEVGFRLTKVVSTAASAGR